MSEENKKTISGSDAFNAIMGRAPSTEEGNEIPEATPDRREEPKGEKVKKTPEQSFSELRASRDEARKKLEELEKEVERLKPLEELQTFSPIASHIKEKYEGDPNKFIETNRQRKQRLKELEEKSGEWEKALAEKENIIREVEVTRSDFYKKEFSEPFVQSTDSLRADILNFDDEGNEIAPIITDALMKDLYNGGKGRSTQEIAKILNIFKSKFKKTTGRDYDAPSTRVVKENLDHLVSLNQKRIDFLTNSEKEIAERKKYKELQAAEESKRRRELERIARDEKEWSLVKNTDWEKWSFLGEREININSLKETRGKLEKIYSGELSVGFEDNLLRAYKADRFDELARKYQELEEKYNSMKSDYDSGLGTSPGSRKVSERSEQPNASWIEKIGKS